MSEQMLLTTDRHTKVKEWNAAAALLTGKERATIEGKKLVDALGLDTKDKTLTKQIATLIKGACTATPGSASAEVTVKVNGETDLLLSIHPWIGVSGGSVGAAISGKLVAPPSVEWFKPKGHHYIGSQIMKDFDGLLYSGANLMTLCACIAS
jgi:hypothetical protein